MKKLRGFTLVEMLIVLVIIAVVLNVMGAAFGGCGNEKIKKNAEEDALSYARTMHPRWERTVTLCQGSDSDGDGYVRCTIGDGTTTEAIECRTSLLTDYARGCVPMRNR